jgi:hypothetical protein
MPWDKKYDKKRKKWVVFVKGEQSKIVGTHTDEGSASKQIAALYAKEPEKKPH